MGLCCQVFWGGRDFVANPPAVARRLLELAAAPMGQSGQPCILDSERARCQATPGPHRHSLTPARHSAPSSELGTHSAPAPGPRHLRSCSETCASPRSGSPPTSRGGVVAHANTVCSGMLTQSAAAKQRRHYLLSAQAPGIMVKLYSQGRAGKAPLLQALQKATSAFAARNMFRNSCTSCMMLSSACILAHEGVAHSSVCSAGRCRSVSGGCVVRSSWRWHSHTAWPAWQSADAAAEVRGCGRAGPDAAAMRAARACDLLLAARCEGW